MERWMPHKAYMMLGYVHNTTKVWNIWDPDLSKAVNCLDLYFDERQCHGVGITCNADIAGPWKLGNGVPPPKDSKTECSRTTGSSGMRECAERESVGVCSCRCLLLSVFARVGVCSCRCLLVSVFARVDVCSCRSLLAWGSSCI